MFQKKWAECRWVVPVWISRAHFARRESQLGSIENRAFHCRFLIRSVSNCVTKPICSDFCIPMLDLGRSDSVHRLCTSRVVLDHFEMIPFVNLSIIGQMSCSAEHPNNFMLRWSLIFVLDIFDTYGKRTCQKWSKRMQNSIWERSYQAIVNNRPPSLTAASQISEVFEINNRCLFIFECQ